MQGQMVNGLSSKGARRERPKVWGNSLSARKTRFGLLFALPAFLFFGYFYLYPLTQTFFVSLYRWGLLDTPAFIGLENYSRLFADKEFINSIRVTFYYAFGTVIPIWAIALGLALVFNQAFRFRQGYLTTYYVPAVISLTVWSLIWLFMYDPSYGAFSALYTRPGAGRRAHARRSGAGDAGHDHPQRVEGHAGLHADLPGRAAGHSRRLLRGGQGGRGQRLAALYLHHAAHAAAR